MSLLKYSCFSFATFAAWREKYLATVALLSQSAEIFSRRANVVIKIIMLLLCGLGGLGEKKNIPRQLLFSRKAAEDAKASQGLDQEVFGLNKKVMKSGKEKEELLKREAEHLAESKA